MKVVRDSKFRHVFGEATKEKYEDLRVSPKIAESTGIRGNSKFICFPWESGGGGTLAVIPRSKSGRCPRDLPLISGHTGPILDFEFNPFDDNMLLSASEDNLMKIWQIPDEGLKAHLRESMADLKGHSKKIMFCTFNPCVSSIVASSAFDLTTKVWNIAEQEEAFSIDMPDQAMHLKWNYTGNLLAVTAKDKKLRIIDPRTNKFCCACKVHDGSKASKVEWLSSPTLMDQNHLLVTTGFTSQAQRQIGVWDMRKFSETEDVEPLNMLDLDNGTGALYPFFDAGTQMLFVAGKGDANVRYFEAVEGEPFLHYVEMFSTITPQKGFCFMPKGCVDVNKHEVMLGLKLESNTIQPVSFKVPRKSKEFQDDLFPNGPAGVPSMVPDEWVSGAEPRPPVLRSMKPGAEAVARPAGAAATGVVSVKDLKKQLAEAQAKIQALEKENEVLKAEVAQLKGS